MKRSGSASFAFMAPRADDGRRAADHAVGVVEASSERLDGHGPAKTPEGLHGQSSQLHVPMNAVVRDGGSCALRFQVTERLESGLRERARDAPRSRMAAMSVARRDAAGPAMRTSSRADCTSAGSSDLELLGDVR